MPHKIINQLTKDEVRVYWMGVHCLLNLDAMPAADLRRVWRLGAFFPNIIADAWFGKQAGRRVAIRHLRNYAINKAVAIGLRLDGNTQDALLYERICQDIYEDIPEFAKW